MSLCTGNPGGDQEQDERCGHPDHAPLEHLSVPSLCGARNDTALSAGASLPVYGIFLTYGCHGTVIDVSLVSPRNCYSSPAEIPLARLKIHLFGGFRVEAEPRTRLAVSRRKGQALLALLALRPGTGYAREALSALLWPESGDEEARHSLRQELHALRRVLAPAGTRALVVSGERIALDPDAVEVDVATFERLSAEGRPEALKRAADLYEGDLMVGIGVREDEFEDHLRSERERLRARAIGVLTRLLAYQAQQGPMEAAIETALRLLVMDPTQESVHRELIRLYARSGRRAAALRQYQDCVEVLQRELGEAPEAATRQPYRDLLAAGGSREAPRQQSAPQSAVDGRRVVRPKNARLGIDPPLVGRQAELARLREVVDETYVRVG